MLINPVADVPAPLIARSADAFFTALRRIYGRHLKDLMRAARNGDWHQDESGMYIAGRWRWAGVMAIGDQRGPNLVTTEGMNYVADVSDHGSAQIGTWYFMPFSTNATPALSWTHANFNANATEQTNYVEATRQAWNEAAASGGIVTTSTRATITANTGGMTIYGAGLGSTSTKGSTSSSEKLLAAKNAGGATTVAAGNTIDLSYTLTLTSS